MSKKPNTPWAKDPACWVYDNVTGKYVPKKYEWKKFRRRHWLRKYMESCGCADCGITDPRVLSFDHIDPKDKSFTILKSGPLKSSSLSSLIAEVRKCEVRCHNCHRIKSVACNDYSHNKVSEELLVQSFCKYHGVDDMEEYYDLLD